MRFKDEAEFEAFCARIANRDTRQVCKRERDTTPSTQTASRAKSSRKTQSKERYRIVVIARRTRDIDPDNMFPKWIIDELVRAKYLPDDSSRFVETIEKRVEIVKGEEEKTIVEIWREIEGDV